MNKRRKLEALLLQELEIEAKAFKSYKKLNHDGGGIDNIDTTKKGVFGILRDRSNPPNSIDISN